MKKFIRILPILLLIVAAFSCKRKEESRKEYESVILNDMHFNSRHLESGVAHFNIYLPADYAVSGKEYPVLYLLHGVLDDHTAWKAKGNMRKITDKAIKSGVVEPFIVVMPDGFLGFYVNGAKNINGKRYGNDWEDYFYNELKPHIEKSYPVKKGRKNTAFAGCSMGGYGSIYHAFNHPDKIGFCYAMSAAIDDLGLLGNIVPSIKEIFKNNGYGEADFNRLPYFVMECGKEDVVSTKFNEHSHRFLKSVDFPHQYRKFDGIHNWEFWQGSYERMLPDLANLFGKGTPYSGQETAQE